MRTPCRKAVAPPPSPPAFALLPDRHPRSQLLGPLTVALSFVLRKSSAGVYALTKGPRDERCAGTHRHLTHTALFALALSGATALCTHASGPYAVAGVAILALLLVENALGDWLLPVSGGAITWWAISTTDHLPELAQLAGWLGLGALISADEAAGGPARQKAIEDEEADGITAVPLGERERQRLSAWANGQIRPWIPDLVIEEFTPVGDQSQGILVVSVPASSDAPHVVGERNELGVPYRDGSHTVWMSDYQLERAYRDRFARQVSEDAALDEQLVEVPISWTWTPGVRGSWSGPVPQRLFRRWRLGGPAGKRSRGR